MPLDFACESDVCAAYEATPVLWHKWEQRSFELAQRDHRLVLVHVAAFGDQQACAMQQNCFSRPQLAEFLNDNFICVLIDPQLQSGVAELLQDYTSALCAGSGGCCNVWFDHLAQPLHAAAELPAFSTGARRGLHEISLALLQKKQQNPRELYAHGHATLQKLQQRHAAHAKRQLPPPDGIAATLHYWQQQYDSACGGFGLQHKIANFGVLKLLANYAAPATRQDPQTAAAAAAMLQGTLDGMLCGGVMFDGVEGGIFSACHGRGWQLPLTQKLLLDQALLLDSLLDGWMLLQAEHYLQAAELLVDFVLERLWMPQQGFFASELAHRTTDQAAAYAYYGYSCPQIEQCARQLTPSVVTLAAISPKGNICPADYAGEHADALQGLNMLPLLCSQKIDWQAANLPPLSSQEVQQLRRQLAELRAGRQQPQLNQLVSVQANAAMLTSLLRWQRLSANRKAEAVIEQLAGQLKPLGLQPDNLPQALYREQILAYKADADTYAHCLQAAIELQFYQPEAGWAAWGARLEKALHRGYWSNQFGCYLRSKAENLQLVDSVRLHDNHYPGVNSLNLLSSPKLEYLTGKSCHSMRQQALLAGVGGYLAEQPCASAWAQCYAWLWRLGLGTLNYTGADYSPLWQQLQQRYWQPNILWRKQADSSHLPAQANLLLDDNCLHFDSAQN